MKPLLWVPVAILCAASSVSAQSAERVWISVNAGAAAGAKAFSDTVQTPLYLENETIKTSYPGGGAVPGIAASGGVKVWRQLTAGVGVTSFSHKADATIDASLPHPFFDNQPRTISGTTRVTHDDTSFDVKAGWLASLSPKIRLLLTAGPSLVNVRQTIVTGVKYAESYPYDTAQFTSAEAQAITHGNVGFNAGADVFWLFSRHLGAGGLVQVTHATVKLPVSGRTVSMDAGGVLGGGGVRLLF